jgi:autotransporter-associated beta strand protein
MKIKNLSLTSLFTLACSQTLSAVDYFWDGGGANGNWATAANWNPDTLPTFNNAADIKFTSAPITQHATFIGADRIVRSLEFNSDSTTAIAVQLSNALNPGSSGAARTLTFDADGGTSSIVVGADSGANVSVGVNTGAAGFVGSITLANNLLVTNNSSTRTLTIGRGITETGGPHALTKDGVGTLIFQSSAIRDFTGGLLIKNGEVAMTNASGVINSANIVTFGDSVGGTSGSWNLRTGNASDQNVAALASAGGTSNLIRSSNGASTLTLSGATGTHSFNGTIQNAVSIVKSGDNTQIFSGTHTYSGTTDINAGTLRVNSTHTGGGLYTVGANGTLQGTGSTASAVNVSGVLSPGASIATFASGTLDMLDASTFEYEVDSSVATASGADLMIVSGDLNLTGTVNLTLTDLASLATAFAPDTTFSLINYSGTWNGGLFTFGGDEIGNGESFTAGLNIWRLDYNAAEGGSNFSGEYLGGSDRFVNITVIPEPSTVLLGVLGAVALLRRRR